MRSGIHDHIEEWLIASLSGRLSSKERAQLRQHLAECDACMERAEDPTLLSHVNSAFEARADLDDSFDELVVTAFRDHIALPVSEPAVCEPSKRRRAVRSGLVAIVALCLMVRTLNVQFVTDAFAGGPALSALWQGVLRSPEYRRFIGQSNILKDHDVFLATVHKLISLYVEVFMWTLLMLAIGLLLSELYRQRRMVLYG